MDETFEKCLSITGSFEGASWGGVTGNFDGMGISAFILQWNLGQRTLQQLLSDMYTADATKFKTAAGEEQTTILVNMYVSGQRTKEQEFVNLVTTGKLHSDSRPDHFNGGQLIKPEWRYTFQQVGLAFKEKQATAAKKYYDDAVEECLKFNLNTERSVAFMFDQCVQRGKASLKDEEAAFLKIEKTPDYKEDDDWWLRFIMEHDAQDVSSVFRDDVRSRRLCILTGAGIVHETLYNLEKEFGLTDEKVL